MNGYVEKDTFYLVEARRCSMNETILIALHATNNTVNIVLMLAIVVLYAFLELYYHLLKIDARALWRRTYAHIVPLGFTSVLRPSQ